MSKNKILSTAKIQTTTYHSLENGTNVVETMFGKTIRETSASGVRENYFDAYGRIFYDEVRPNTNTTARSHKWYGRDSHGDLIEEDTFTAINTRSEVASAEIGGDSYVYNYDSIGNNIWTALNLSTNLYAANNLNQYTSISSLLVSSPPREPIYDAAGNMTFDGTLNYAYDYENRLVSVSTNSVTIQTNFYDHKGRRVRKVTPNAEHTFIYDGWNLEKEIIISDGFTNTIEYIWGRDLSGTLQGAGGVGGLVAVKRNGELYIPLYDHNGNITDYISGSGTTVAHYDYDAFGRTITQSGSMAEIFAHRLSSKYFDSETGFYYYGYRFYSPTLMRWINRDPMNENGGVNLYAMCQNDCINKYDLLGMVFGMTYVEFDAFLGHGWIRLGGTTSYKLTPEEFGLRQPLIASLPNGIGFYPSKELNGLDVLLPTDGHWQTEEEKELLVAKLKTGLKEWDLELSSEKWFGHSDKRLMYGKARNKCCKDVNASEAKDCIMDYTQKNFNHSYWLPFWNCRRIANDALEACCLKKGKQKTKPNYGSIRSTQ